MSLFLSTFGLMAMVAVAVVLTLGLWNMAKAGSPNRSQALMRLRVMMQCIALALLMMFLWFSGR